jgi:hypothetical protein
MSLMLPSLNSAQPSLADVLPSCLASLGIAGQSNALALPDVRCSIVVLVDGLGEHNLRSARAHARFLTQHSGNSIRTVFPSTTAAALASLTTGSAPGEHGMTGYKVRNPDSGQLMNSLTGLGVLADPASWLLKKPLYSLATQHGVSASVVAHPRFADSTLTTVIHAGADQVSAKSIEERVHAAIEISKKPGSHLVLLYVSELDEIAHNKGVESSEWAATLETLDSALRALVENLPGGSGVLVTADHGVIDVPAQRHYLYGLDPEHMEHIAEVGGEPRCLQLYFSDYVSSEEKKSSLESWQHDWSELAWVLSKEEVIASGLYEEVSPESSPRLGDIFIMAKKDVVFYDERDLTLKGRNMIGQHGGVSPQELEIPAIRLGAYAAV